MIRALADEQENAADEQAEIAQQETERGDRQQPIFRDVKHEDSEGEWDGNAQSTKECALTQCVFGEQEKDESVLEDCADVDERVQQMRSHGGNGDDARYMYECEMNEPQNALRSQHRHIHQNDITIHVEKRLVCLFDIACVLMMLS
eukprot:CAMPEP_0202697994 /NCGR_PEP_ID=MMETSP1385-20130828/11279_1 /ASSEMBLY_ACC=CAM_ASM_000861 /TAXON_ID=933848 /ORGANISM="Elphidium margaritaceum" /LENGTH=145 /DNA_ID=CAMNT_0049354587 /DNA_START=249 /DNA_END=686 /DNA_ORIENTATION=-